MIETNESIKQRIVALIPHAEMCSMFSALVKDVAQEHRLTYERALSATTDALIQGSSCFVPEALPVSSPSQKPAATTKETKPDTNASLGAAQQDSGSADNMAGVGSKQREETGSEWARQPLPKIRTSEGNVGSVEVFGVRQGHWNNEINDIEFGNWIKADSGNDFKTDNWRVAFELLSKLQADGARGLFIQPYK